MTTTVTPNRLNAGYPWFRFSQDAGNKLMDWCVPAFSCGTIGGMWSDSTMPSKIGVSTEIKFHIADYSSCSTLLEVGLCRGNSLKMRMISSTNMELRPQRQVHATAILD